MKRKRQRRDTQARAQERIAGEHPALGETTQHERPRARACLRGLDQRHQPRARVGQVGGVLAREIAGPGGQRPRAQVGVDVPPRAPARASLERAFRKKKPRGCLQRVREGCQIGGDHLEAVEQHDDDARGVGVADGDRPQAAEVERRLGRGHEGSRGPWDTNLVGVSALSGCTVPRAGPVPETRRRRTLRSPPGARWK